MVRDLTYDYRSDFDRWLFMDSYCRRFTLPAALLLLAYIAIALAGCTKKPVASSPPFASAPAPATTTTAPMPTNERKPPTIVQFEAEPTSIQRPQSAILRWDVSGDLTAVSIDQGIGTVQNRGSRQVSPGNSITYALTATGPGGTVTALTTVRVSLPPPHLPSPTAPAAMTPLDQRIATEIEDIYYDYDSSEVRTVNRDTLVRDVAALKGILADFREPSENSA